MAPRDLDIDVCNNFLGVGVVAKGVDEKSTIGDIGKAMRRDFFEKRKSGSLFGGVEENPERPESCVVCLSNLGPLVVKEPFEDVWMQQTMDSNYANGSLCLLSWSKIDQGRNDFWGRLRYSPQVFSRRQAESIAKSIAYVLEVLPATTRVDSAVEELARLQSAHS
jgi:hypothetical protein